MAGLTKLQAVNQCVMAVRMGRVAALDSGGGSDASDAEFVIDTVMDEFILAGHPSTTKAAQVFTASAGGVVDVGSSPPVIGVRGVGRHAGRKLTLQGQFVYDEGYGSTQCFAASETGIILDLFTKKAATSPTDFEDLDPGFKSIITQEAVKRFRLLKLPDAFMHQALEAVQAGTLAAGVGATDRRVERPAGISPFAQASGGPASGRRGQ